MRSPLRTLRSTQGWPGQEQVTMPESSWMTAWKMRRPRRVGRMPLLRTSPTTVTSIPTCASAIGVMVEASS